MSYQDSPFSTMYGHDDYDIDDDNEEYLEDDRDPEEQDESDEGTMRDNASGLRVSNDPYEFADTEEASETDLGKSEEYTEIKEQ